MVKYLKICLQNLPLNVILFGLDGVYVTSYLGCNLHKLELEGSNEVLKQQKHTCTVQLIHLFICHYHFFFYHFHHFILYLKFSKTFFLTLLLKCHLWSCFSHRSCLDQQDSDEEEPNMEVTRNLNPGSQDRSNFQPYIPEEFANFENYNATLDNQESAGSDPKGSRCGGGEVSRSPTTSSCTSGYFSHSASNATLSDVPFSASESSDRLSCTSRESHDPPSCPPGRSYLQARSLSGGSEAQQLPPSAPQLGPSPSEPVNIPNCTDPLPQNCVLSTSQEFTDFKGADDGFGEGELSHFTQEWQKKGSQFSEKHQERTDMELCHTDIQPCSDVANETSVEDKVMCKRSSPEDNASVSVLSPDSSVKAPSPSAPLLGPASSALSASAPSSARAPRAGGEPPIQEPAQGDLPHGSPCPSPNPSSAEPSGDSSGDEGTPVAQLPDWMAPGEQVWVGKRRGTVHYVGGVEFAKGIWIGVKLDLAVGKAASVTLLVQQ